MAKRLMSTRIALAIAAALGMCAANAVVVVGGAQGWEVSFDGNPDTSYGHKSPLLVGLQAEAGLSDPSADGANGRANRLPKQTATPRIEGELAYNASLGEATFKGWLDGLWQNLDSAGRNTPTPGRLDVHSWGAGGSAGYRGLNLSAYYYEGAGLGGSLQLLGNTACDAGVAVGKVGALSCAMSENDGYYLQGTYTVFGKTKVGASYGQSNQAKFENPDVLSFANQDVSLNLWTVGMYHDVNSWLKLIAEYSDAKNKFKANAVAPGTLNGETESQTLSLGTFFIW